MAMKVMLGLALLLLQPFGSSAHPDYLHLKRAQHHAMLERQLAASASTPSSHLPAVATASSGPAVLIAGSGPAVSNATPAPAVSIATSAPAVSVATSASAPPAAASLGTVPLSAPPSTLTATNPNIPPLSAIISGMPSQPTPSFSITFTPGATPPFSGALPLPTTSLDRSKYPVPTGSPPIDTPLVQAWLKKLENVSIPDIPPTKGEALCAENPDAATDTSRCWWTCGGCTRDTDVVNCPNKMDWGLSFDDGPSPYSPLVISALQQQNLTATFFAVGSSSYWNAPLLQVEHMLGHQIGAHTYFHPHLTTIPSINIVAELAYSIEIIKDIIGVTPTFLRPPYGDVDDRVRAIAAAMGLKIVLWTRDPVTHDQFDTNDWKIASGGSTGASCQAQFQNILQNASTHLTTGFIALEHDLYQQSADLAAGYTIPAALQHNPAFNLKSINRCLGISLADSYLETSSNKNPLTFSTNWTGNFVRGIQGSNGTSNGTSSDGNTGSGSGNNSKVNSKGNGGSRVELGAGVLMAGLLALLVTLLA